MSRIGFHRFSTEEANEGARRINGRFGSKTIHLPGADPADGFFWEAMAGSLFSACEQKNRG
jgi:hypothetical protein